MERHPDLPRAVEVLVAPELAQICDMVLHQGEAPGTFVARSHYGMATFRRLREEGTWRYEVLETEGRNPLAHADASAFSPAAAERAQLHPPGESNHYPNAFETVSQLFDDPNAPDLAAVHSASHNWEDLGGHLGEHGSLDVVQARAPMIVSGQGFRRHGRLDSGIRNVDIAPTLATLLDVEARRGTTVTGDERDGLLLARQDGRVVEELLDGSTPRHVVFFLLDGANSNVLYELVDAGRLPNIAGLAAAGTTLAHGALSSFPTVTLSNHTTMLTGAYPGHHGILHNAYWDRASRAQIVTNSPTTWAMARGWMRPDVETLQEALHRSRPDAFTACVNEPCDRGASYSTFDFFRRGEVPAIVAPHEVPNTHEHFVRPYKDYAWSVSVDHMATEQAVGIWSGAYRGEAYPLPTFMWVNFTLTDTAMHRGGPHSEMAAASLVETDARIGEVLTAIDAAGVMDDCAFCVSADHGMEESDPGVRGDWGASLDAAGIRFRDEGFGFVYLGAGG